MRTYLAAAVAASVLVSSGAWAQEASRVECILIDGARVVATRDSCRARTGLVARTLEPGEKANTAPSPYTAALGGLPGRFGLPNLDPELGELHPFTKKETIALQKALGSLGFYQGRNMTGSLNAETRAALESFQRSRGLVVTGDPDHPTITAMTKLLDRNYNLYRGLERTGSGTGFYVTQNTILTNAHVVKDCEMMVVRVARNTTVWGNIVARNENLDLALVETRRTTGPVASFRKSPPIRQGDEIVVLGFPLGDTLGNAYSVTAGYVTALTEMQGRENRLTMSAPIQPGNSGGPVLDRGGLIVGISVAVAGNSATQNPDVTPQNVNFAILGDIAQDFLIRHRISPRAAPAGKTMSVADVAEFAAGFTRQMLCMKRKS